MIRAGFDRDPDEWPTAAEAARDEADAGPPPPRPAWLKCHTHGPRAYVLDPRTFRYRCPVEDCPAFMDAELVERRRAAQLAALDPWHDPTAPPLEAPF